MGWFESIEHSRWLSEEMRGLLRHGHAAMTATGFAFTNTDGTADLTKPVDLALTARMTYAYSLGVLMGIPGSRRYCDHGVRCMIAYFKDQQHGGWYKAIKHEPDSDGSGVPWDEDGSQKWQYAHAFLILAAATASIANRPGAHELLNEALAEQKEHWLDPVNSLIAENANRDWTEFSPMRAMNSLMHTVEAYLAASEATQDAQWLYAAERMLRFVYGVASQNDWRVPEHFTDKWEPVYDFNKNEPATPYYPYGFVIGHGMELSRLAIQTRAGLRAKSEHNYDYLAVMAEELFERSRIDGWRRNGHPGFVFSVDFEGNPVLSDRLQWVVSEGICATAFLRNAMLDDGASVGEVEVYEHCYRSWLDYLNDHMQVAPGVFVRALNADNQRTSDTVSSRPDIYHPLQALLSARLPVWPPFASALAHDLLDHPRSPHEAPKNRKDKRGFLR